MRESQILAFLLVFTNLYMGKQKTETKSKLKIAAILGVVVIVSIVAFLIYHFRNSGKQTGGSPKKNTPNKKKAPLPKD